MRRGEMYVPLLLCVLFAMVSMTTSTPEIKNTNVTVEGNDTTRQPTTAHVNVLQSAVWTPEHKLEDVRTPAPVVENDTREPTTISSKTSSRGGSVVVTANAAAGTSSSGLPASTEGLITKPEAPAGTTSRGAAKPSTAVSTGTTETPPSTSVSIEVNTSRGEPSTAATTASTETQPSTVVTTATDQVLPSFSTTTTTGGAQSLNHTTADALHQTSTSSFTNKTATASSTVLATVAVSSLQPTAITENTPESLSTTSLNNQTVPTFNQNLSHPTESTSKTSPELSATSRPASTTSLLISTTGPSETTPPSSTTGNSTSAGILIPRQPKRLPFPTSRSTPATTIPPCEPTKDPPSHQIQPCSTRSTANQCLIIIASLATVATIFMISTIVLCVKLSARNYKGRNPQQSTELMCISALLPEKTYMRQRNPVSNGVLVFPAGGDSDEEVEDNLTLSSFLPDNERYV